VLATISGHGCGGVGENENMATTIGRGVNITGSLTADEPVFITGTLNGDVLVANHAVTVETGGRVEGAVTARVITVQGGSVGRLIARDVVRLLEGSRVQADIASPKLALEEGAVFTGKVDGGARAEAATRVAKYRQNGTPEPGPARS
jgi:cytoskeletal protein CcmA (bactofilin family)